MERTLPADGHVHDAIVVSGGIAGLSVGWRLRHREVLLLEASSRFGGRIRSERRGHYWLNFGAHVFGGPATATGRLINEVGTEALAVPGRLTALAMSGVLLKTGRFETYPLWLPMAFSSRVAALRVGAKVRAVLRYGRIAAERPGEDFRVRQQRMYDFLGEGTFADFIGPLPPDVYAPFRPAVTRSGADPEELSAGAGVGYFHLVWDRGEGLSRNIVGGSSTLPAALAAALGPKALHGARVTGVAPADEVVRVTYENDGTAHEALARHVVVATPAYVAREIVADLPPDVARALDRIVYGPSIAVSFLTGEQVAQPWDDCYAIATPGQPFNMVFNSRACAAERSSSDIPAAASWHIRRRGWRDRCSNSPTRRSSTPTSITWTRCPPASPGSSPRREPSAGRTAWPTRTPGGTAPARARAAARERPPRGRLPRHLVHGNGGPDRVCGRPGDPEPPCRATVTRRARGRRSASTETAERHTPPSTKGWT